MGSIPLPALGIKPPEQVNPLDQYAKIMQLRNLAAQQQMLPIEMQQKEQGLQQGQQQIQSNALDIQQKQISLRNQEIAQSTISDPNFESDFKSWQDSKKSTAGGSSAAASSSSGQNQPLFMASAANGSPAAPAPAGGASSDQSALQLHPLAQYLVEKKGLPLLGPNGAIEVSQSLTKATQDVATLLKTQGDTAATKLANHQKQLDNFDELAEPILNEKDPAKQQQGLADLRAEIQQNPDLYPPEATQHLDTLGTMQGLQQAANTSKVRQMLIDDGTKQAGLDTAQAGAKQAQIKAAAPTPEQITNATATLNTYSAVPPNMRAGLAKEMQTAPTYEALQKVQDRADAANESFQRSADARAQANAIKDVGIQQVVAGKLVTEDQKLGSALDQTSGIRGLLDMSKGGNEAATAAAQTRFAEHEIVEGGVKRMNQTEYQNLAGSLGDYGRKFSAWVDQGFKGQMPPATNAEMAKILDAEDAAANGAHERNVGYIMNRYAPENMRGNAPAAKQNNPTPQTHSFSASAWKAANPNGDVNAAKAAAMKAGYQVNP